MPIRFSQSFHLLKVIITTITEFFTSQAVRLDWLANKLLVLPRNLKKLRVLFIENLALSVK